MSRRPIGVFDSGVGGLTVARAIIDLLPSESITYVGDTARGPYGPKSIDEVSDIALEIMDSLVARGVKALVIACNSASAATLPIARERYSVPVVEVIGPAVSTATQTTKNRKVGVIGTQATINSGAYQNLFDSEGEFEMVAQSCPRFVELVEQGITSGPEVIEIATDYLRPLSKAGVDTVVLGCTHYPLLAGPISYVMGRQVTLISSAQETARELYQLLEDEDLAAPVGSLPTYEFLVTGESGRFASLARRFLGPEVQAVRPFNS